MINIKILLSNPYSHYFKNLKCWHGMLSKHKAWEVQLYYTASTIVEASLNIDPTGHDHAGANLNLTLFGFTVNAQYYDTRHWDYDNNCWEDPSRFTENAC